MEIEDKTGINKRGNMFVSPKPTLERNDFLIDKREKMYDKYSFIRPYITNIFSENLKFDSSSCRRFVDSISDILKFIDDTTTYNANEEFKLGNPGTKFHECEFYDMSFIKVFLVELLVFFYTIENKLELHIQKYPIFGKYEKRGLEKIRENLKRLCQKFETKKKSTNIEEFVGCLLKLEDKWLDWKNKKSVGQIFKLEKVVLQKSKVIRRLQ